MSNKEIMIIADYSQDTTFTLSELCELCGLSLEAVDELVAYEIIRPTTAHAEEWVFDLPQLQRVRRALRLQRDLEMNLASVALVLELLEELEQVRSRAILLEKHLLR